MTYFRDGWFETTVKFGNGQHVQILGTQTLSLVIGVKVSSISCHEPEYAVSVRKDAVYPYTQDVMWVKESLLEAV